MKSVVFRYFDVDNEGLTSSSSLVGRLIGKLSSVAADRMMPLNKQESDKSDLISDFDNINQGQMITGTYLRIVNSKEVPIITEEMLKQKQFKVSSINTNANEKEKTCLDYFYFCLSDKKLIVTLDMRCGITRLETYVNWLLNTKDSGESISFTPIVDEEKVSVADLKEIKIDNSYNLVVSENGHAESGIKSKMVDITKQVMNGLFSETDSLKELMDANICSANLVIKFSKPRGMDVDEYRRKTVGTILKPMENPDGIKFKTNGKKIQGSEVLKTETVEIEDVDGAISEQEVYQKMVKRLLQQ